MKRREFITLVGGAAAAWPFAARAQQEPIRPLIALLSPLSAATASRNVAAFRSALRDYGYVEGRNMTLVLRFGEGAPERMEVLARELVALKPDVLLAGSLSGAQAGRVATQTIPIVTVTPEDPVTSGFGQSIAKPGGNVTGTWLLGDDALVGKRLDFLKLAVPGLARVGALINPDEPTDRVQTSKLLPASRALNLDTKVFEVRDVTKLDTVASEVARAGVEGLYVGHGPTLNTARVQITAWAARLKLPAMYGFREFVDVGGLMSYGPNLPDIYRQSARLVDRVLKGANPADLPFELPARYELIVNLKTAKTIGLKMPDSFVLLADEVIE
jgi:ABC-type uncharacterized transport system substrate-binding protein